MDALNQILESNKTIIIEMSKLLSKMNELNDRLNQLNKIIYGSKEEHINWMFKTISTCKQVLISQVY